MFVMDEALAMRLRRLAEVPRWTVIPVLRRQSVAEHSFHVATVALWLAGRSSAVVRGEVDRSDLLTAALTHDSSEAVCGDLPTPSKRHLEPNLTNLEETLGVKKWPENVRNIVKCADMLEAIMFLREEELMGNKRIDAVLAQILDRFDHQWAKFEWHGDDKPVPSRMVNSAFDTFLGGIYGNRHPGMEIPDASDETEHPF